MKGPSEPGLYWLALDQGGGFSHHEPLLVRVAILAPYNEGRITFLNHPDLDPERNLQPVIDGVGLGLSGFVEGARYEFGGSIIALRWRGRVRAPKLPKASKL